MAETIVPEVDKKTALYSYYFHYNTYDKAWNAFKREDSVSYFNGGDKPYLKSEDINTLIDYIIKTESNVKSKQ